MDPKKRMMSALGKIKSIFWNLSQDRRITSDELEDFNSAMTNAWDAKNEYDYVVAAIDDSEKRSMKLIDDAAIREKKLHILCSILGMHDLGIERWNEYPIRFITIINAQLRRMNQPIYSENYFEVIDMRWRWLNNMIDRDLHSIEMINRMKSVYRTSDNENVKYKSAEILKMIHNEIGYLENDIKAGKPVSELKRKVIEFWYDELSAHNTSGEKSGN